MQKTFILATPPRLSFQTCYEFGMSVAETAAHRNCHRSTVEMKFRAFRAQEQRAASDVARRAARPRTRSSNYAGDLLDMAEKISRQDWGALWPTEEPVYDNDCTLLLRELPRAISCRRGKDVFGKRPKEALA